VAPCWSSASSPSWATAASADGPSLYRRRPSLPRPNGSIAASTRSRHGRSRRIYRSVPSHMNVELVNDRTVTFLLDSRKLFLKVPIPAQPWSKRPWMWSARGFRPSRGRDRRRSRSDDPRSSGPEAMASRTECRIERDQRRTRCGTPASSAPACAELAPWARRGLGRRRARTGHNRAPMNVDRAGEVGGRAVVEPVGIGEPGVGLGKSNELARARMVQGRILPARRRSGPGRSPPRQPEGRGRGPVGRVGDVDVRQLMVADGEGTARKGIEDLAEGTTAGRRGSRPGGGFD